MYNAKALLALTALAGVSVATTFPAPECPALEKQLLEGAPQPSKELYDLFGIKPDGDASEVPSQLLSDPGAYIDVLCSVVPTLPEEQQSVFAEYGGSLLAYASKSVDLYAEVATKCVVTGTAATSVTSVFHSLAESPEAVCQPTSTSAPAGGNGTAVITPYPTMTPAPTGNGTAPAPTSSVPVVAGAAGPNSVFAGAIAAGALAGAVALL
ncbi:hypothetical protein F4808DRAFT_2657 [Astrocystis sublimbata]|nr:hypothetical protein F4808DRAFT_2657 [Astrocystis sublimbata]